MLTFNHVLDGEGIEPSEVYLLRHQDQRAGKGSLYQLWVNPDSRPQFEEYQRIQHRKFKVGGLLASFVVTPLGRTLFVGLYRVAADGIAPAGTTDPLGGHDVTGLHYYDLEMLPELNDYVGRLSIKWGAATRAWYQRAVGPAPKEVDSISDDQDPPFPGFSEFRWDVSEIPRLYPSWAAQLRIVKGIYLLVDEHTGEQYVGSAKGDESLYGRWMQYAKTGHGGNVRLVGEARQERRPFQVSILQVVDTSVSDERIEKIEATWKERLLTRKFGLNAN